MDDRNLYGRAEGLNERGRHPTFRSAVASALGGMLTVRSTFLDSVNDAWPRLFPGMTAMMPGAFLDGILWLYVSNSAAMFAMRPKLAGVRAKLAALPGAPKRLAVKMKIHTPGVR